MWRKPIGECEMEIHPRLYNVIYKIELKYNWTSTEICLKSTTEVFSIKRSIYIIFPLFLGGV